VVFAWLKCGHESGKWESYKVSYIKTRIIAVTLRNFPDATKACHKYPQIEMLKEHFENISIGDAMTIVA
jgi:hypothetical protein